MYCASVFYSITMYQKNVIASTSSGIPSKECGREGLQKKKMAQCICGRLLFLLPLINSLAFILVNHFLYLFLFSHSVIVNTLITCTSETSEVFFVFIILLINPDTGSESWNVTSLSGTKTLRMRALTETSSRAIAMIPSIWGSVERNCRQD